MASSRSAYGPTGFSFPSRKPTTGGTPWLTVRSRPSRPRHASPAPTPTATATRAVAGRRSVGVVAVASPATAPTPSRRTCACSTASAPRWRRPRTTTRWSPPRRPSGCAASCVASGRSLAPTASAGLSGSRWPPRCRRSRRSRSGSSSRSSTTCSSRCPPRLAVAAGRRDGVARPGRGAALSSVTSTSPPGWGAVHAVRAGQGLRPLQRLEPDALDKRRHGDVLSRLSGDLHAIETLLLSAFPPRPSRPRRGCSSSSAPSSCSRGSSRSPPWS